MSQLRQWILDSGYEKPIFSGKAVINILKSKDESAKRVAINPGLNEDYKHFLTEGAENAYTMIEDIIGTTSSDFVEGDPVLIGPA